MKRVLGDAQLRPDYLVATIGGVFGLFCLGGWYSTSKNLENAKNDAQKNIIRSKVYKNFFHMQTDYRIEKKYIDELQDILDNLSKKSSLGDKESYNLLNDYKYKNMTVSLLAQGALKFENKEMAKDPNIQKLYEMTVNSNLINEDSEIKRMANRLIKAGLIVPLSSKGTSSGK